MSGGESLCPDWNFKVPLVASRWEYVTNDSCRFFSIHHGLKNKRIKVKLSL
jgi:hypothetical protein